MSELSDRRLDDLRREALAAARSLGGAEGPLVDALHGLQVENARASDAYRAMVRSLAMALEARDGYTGEHSDAVFALSIGVARELGIDEAGIAEVAAVALLHDIGKIGIPDRILHKPGPLNAEEWAMMRRHPVIGERILQPLPGMESVARAVRHEHERWDGRGYPDRLKGEDIPLASRIVLACDTWNALVSNRPYRTALPEAVARAELIRCSGSQFDPDVVQALLRCLSDGETLERARALHEAAVLPAELSAGEENRRLERELRALLSVGTAVASAYGLDDLLEVAAEEALRATGAESLSISRFDPQHDLLRTLINVGQLGPGEQRHPSDEVYRTSDYPVLLQLLSEGRPHLVTLADAEQNPREVELLRGIGKHCSIAVPILFGGRPWGEVWATRGPGCPVFDDRDNRFLLAIAGQIAAGIGRAELFSRMAELAYQDELTGVGNRRALEERLEVIAPQCVTEGRSLALMLCDVDNLKDLNDGRGHDVGDEALRSVAETLVAVAGDRRALVSRLSGDEFCLLVEDAGAEEVQGLAETALALLARQEPPVGMSCGIAALREGATRPADLLRAADTALYLAKRTGRGRVCLAERPGEATWRATAGERRERRALRESGHADTAALLSDTLRALDGPLAARPSVDRLTAVLIACATAVDASAAALSFCAADSETLETVHAHDRRAGKHQEPTDIATVGESYALADYPASARVLETEGSFVVHAGDPDADAAERELIQAFGLSAICAAATADGRGRWLLEVFADGRTAELDGIEGAMRLLAAHAARGGRGVAPALEAVADPLPGIIAAR